MIRGTKGDFQQVIAPTTENLHEKLWETLHIGITGEWVHSGWVHEDSNAYHLAYKTSGVALKSPSS